MKKLRSLVSIRAGVASMLKVISASMLRSISEGGFIGRNRMLGSFLR